MNNFLNEQRTRLIGAWQLVRWEIAYDDSRPTSYPYGPDASGWIQYSNDGVMSACIARAQRPRLSSASVRSAPEQERLNAFESYFQYAGPFDVQKTMQGMQVIHHVTHALNPNFVGTDQIRNMSFDEKGLLTLSASDPVPDTTIDRHHRLIWKKRQSA